MAVLVAPAGLRLDSLSLVLRLASGNAFVSTTFKPTLPIPAAEQRQQPVKVGVRKQFIPSV